MASAMTRVTRFCVIPLAPLRTPEGVIADEATTPKCRRATSPRPSHRDQVVAVNNQVAVPRANGLPVSRRAF